MAVAMFVSPEMKAVEALRRIGVPVLNDQLFRHAPGNTRERVNRRRRCKRAVVRHFGLSGRQWRKWYRANKHLLIDVK